MRIPSKVGGFNAEYYPPFFANAPSSNAAAWFNGIDVPAKTMQLTMSKKTVTRTNKSGLNRLNNPDAVEEETKEGLDIDALRAEVLSLR